MYDRVCGCTPGYMDLTGYVGDRSMWVYDRVYGCTPGYIDVRQGIWI